MAFHWALAQFHGTMELFPSTLEVGTPFKMQQPLFPPCAVHHMTGMVQERIFAFTYLLLAYLLAVVFISFITSAMTRPGILD